MYEIGKEEIDAVASVINNKQLFRYQLDHNSQCQIFEREVAEKLGVKYALLVTSGTNALVCALAALGIGPGDEVIIPSYTFVATSLAVTMVGAIPIIANVDEQLSISITSLKDKITDRTKAIIPVHMDGLASNLDDILNLSKEQDLFVIEDTAQAFGGKYKGKFLGTLGDVGCFSFNVDKVITAGEGGLVITNDRVLYERMFCMMDSSGTFNPCNKDMFQEISPISGMSMRVSNITGAILNVQLNRLDTILSNLRARKAIFKEVLADLKSARLITGHDLDGDCSSTIHLHLNGPEQAIITGKFLRMAGFLAYPPTMLPAHVCWKWTNMLGDKFTSFHPDVNPYNSSDSTYNYSSANYMDSMDLIMSCIKYSIDYSLTLEQTYDVARSIKKIIEQHSM